MALASFRFDNRVLDKESERFSGYWQHALSDLIHQLAPLNLPRRLIKTAAITFPACPAFASIDVTVPLVGVLPDKGHAVVLALPSATRLTVNNAFIGFVSATDVVTVRQLCVNASGIAGFTDTFTIMVFI